MTDRVVDSVGQKLNGCPARVVSVGNEIYCGRFITVWVASCHTATIHHCAGPQLMKNLTCSAPTITERPLLGKESESGQTSIIICFTLSSAAAGCNTSWARSKTLSRLIIHLMCVALRSNSTESGVSVWASLPDQHVASSSCRLRNARRPI